MSPQRWQRTEELFFAAEEMSGAERAHFLDRECGTDSELRREVEALLGSAGRTLQAVHHSMEALASDVLRGEDTGPGARIGQYEIIRELGAGGMGVVYLARRAGDFRQLVAIKLLRAGVNQRELLLRFRAERQILANLVHPNIARLLDGGVTPGGQPYLAMEYVDGLPMLEYCRQHQPTVAQRLAMFRQVCSGVECAHRNLVVHRDIKPANILVDSSGVPKLLDFGIAKLLAPEQVEQTIALTTYTERLMTPEYASPEQVRGEAITTATDVYSLGVVLYELLTGARPLKFKTKTPVEIERVICETEPARPGTLAKVDADLDTIILRAMDKSPLRRYATATEFSEDIRRHLEGFPIQARRDSVTYRLGKFVRRNRWAVALAALAALLIVAFGVGMGIVGRRAQVARERAEAVSTFLTGMFEAADPEKTGTTALSARDLLERGNARLATLKKEPEVHAKLLRTMGLAYESLGEWRQARARLEEALSLERSLHRGASEDVAQGLKNLAELQRRLGDPAAAERSAREAMGIWKELRGPADEMYLESQNTLALAVQEGGRPREAAALFEGILAHRDKISSTTNFDTAILSNLGGVYTTLGDYPRAEKFLRECLAIRERNLGASHPRLPRVTIRIARALRLQGRYDEAEAMLTRTAEVQHKNYGERHPDLAATYIAFAAIRREQGRWAGAEDYLSRAETIQRSLGLNHSGEIEVARAQLQEAREDYGLAESLYQMALEKQTANLGGESVGARQSRLALGSVALRRGDLPRARKVLETAIAKQRGKPLAEPEAADLDVLEARFRQASGDPQAAAVLYRRALEFRRRTLVATHPALWEPLVGLGEVTCLNGHAAEGSQFIHEAATLARRFPPPLQVKAREAERRLVACRVG